MTLETNEIYKALVGFQREVPVIGHSRKVDAGKLRYSYAEFQAIVAEIRPILAKNGLAFTQMFQGDALVTRVCHESGQHIEASMPLSIAGMAPQAAGSAITYYRRYSLTAILGLATDDDDDGAGGDKRLNGKTVDPVPPSKMSDAELEAWTAKMKAAASGADIRKIFSEATTACAAIGDTESHALLKASATSLIAGLQA